MASLSHLFCYFVRSFLPLSSPESSSLGAYLVIDCKRRNIHPDPYKNQRKSPDNETAGFDAGIWKPTVREGKCICCSKDQIGPNNSLQVCFEAAREVSKTLDSETDQESPSHHRYHWYSWAQEE